MKRIKVLGLLFFALLLISCGGGGGGGGDISDTPVVDGPWLCFIAGKSNSTISTVITDQYGTVISPIPVLEYSRDGINWKSFIIADTIVTLARPGDRVYIRATDTNAAFSYYNVVDYDLNRRVISFKLNGYGIAAKGNIMSLVDKNCTSKTIPCEGCFYRLFKGCYELTSAPELPAESLTNSCYEEMFRGCSALTMAPILPAVTMKPQCYSSMFQGCSSLLEAPELSSTTLAEGCYSAMFRGCSALTAAPELPSTMLAGGCYSSMFYDCYRIISPPELPASTLAEGCYSSMFNGCESLVVAPELPATVLEDYCYYHMFESCHGLQSIIVHFIDWNNDGNATRGWFAYTCAGGEFHCRTGLPTSGYGTYVPNSWTVIQDVPEPTP